MTDLAASFELSFERMDSPSPSVAERMRALYEDHVGYVWTALRRLGVREADLEDLTQDVFLRIFRDWQRFDATRPPRPWLLGVAYHVAIDFLRRQNHLPREDEALAELATEAPDPEQAASSAQERQVLKTILESMDVNRRTVLVLHELLGHTVPEIAAALEIPLNTAYSRLRLARVDFDARVQKWTTRATKAST